MSRLALVLMSVLLALGAREAAASAGVIAAASGAMRPGAPVEAGDTIATGSGQFVNIAFVDGTSLTVGPETSLRIERFIYDPATNKGELAVTVTAGEFRVVGGWIGRADGISVTTPSGPVIFKDAIAASVVTTDVTLVGVLSGGARRAEGAGKAGGAVVVVKVTREADAVALPALQQALQLAGSPRAAADAARLQAAFAQNVMNTQARAPANQAAGASSDPGDSSMASSGLSASLSSGQSDPSSAVGGSAVRLRNLLKVSAVGHAAVTHASHTTSVAKSTKK